MDSVWVFNGVRGRFPAAVFSTIDKANAWISEHRLSGTLTEYPIDVAVYEWAIASGAFKPKRPDQSEPQFIQRFSSASQRHFHYENGANAESEQGISHDGQNDH